MDLLSTYRGTGVTSGGPDETGAQLSLAAQATALWLPVGGHCLNGKSVKIARFTPRDNRERKNSGSLCLGDSATVAHGYANGLGFNQRLVEPL